MHRQFRKRTLITLLLFTQKVYEAFSVRMPVILRINKRIHTPLEIQQEL